MDQLLVPVRAGRCGRHELETHAPELVQKRLVGLAAEAAQHARLVQTAGSKPGRVDIAVPHTLIIGQQDGFCCVLRLLHGAYIARRLHAQQLHRIVCELLPDAQRQHDQRLTAFMLRDNAAVFQLLHGLAETEPLKQAAPSASYRPFHRVPLVRLERRIYVTVRNSKAGFRSGHDLAAQKVHVGHTRSPRTYRTGMPSVSACRISACMPSLMWSP